LAFVTPSYAPDFELCRDLHASLLQHTDETVVHHVVAPNCDVAQFRALEGPRCTIWPLSELVPNRFLAVPRVNAWFNVRRPWPPVRGWVMQQLVKLAFTKQLGADVVVLIDSDVVLVRPVTIETYAGPGEVALFREVGAVHPGLSRHVRWHAVARHLLGLPPASPPLNDYVNAMTVWEPAVVSALCDRVEQVSGRPWMDTLAANLHFSEDILYGVFVDEVLRPDDRTVVRHSPCWCYWDEEPLDRDGAVGFATSLRSDDVAVMISAKSRTPLDDRRAAWRAVAQALDTAHA
jgi:hypothetical protein